MLNLYFKILNSLKGLKYTTYNEWFLIRYPGPVGCSAHTHYGLAAWVIEEEGWSLEPRCLKQKPISKALEVMLLNLPLRSFINNRIFKNIFRDHAMSHIWRSEGNLSGINSLLPPCVVWEPNSSCLAWQQTLAKASCWPSDRITDTSFVSISTFQILKYDYSHFGKQNRNKVLIIITLSFLSACLSFS